MSGPADEALGFEPAELVGDRSGARQTHLRSDLRTVGASPCSLIQSPITATLSTTRATVSSVTCNDSWRGRPGRTGRGRRQRRS